MQRMLHECAWLGRMTCRHVLRVTSCCMGTAFIGAMLWAVPQVSNAVDGKRHTLSAEEIWRTFVGRIATDGTHWSYFLKPNGKIAAVELGRQRSGHWVIRSKELCLSVPEGVPEDCWLVVRENGKLIFRRNGLDVMDVTVEAPSGYQRKW